MTLEIEVKKKQTDRQTGHKLVCNQWNTPITRAHYKFSLSSYYYIQETHQEMT